MANTRTASFSAAFHSRMRRSMSRCTWILVRQAQRTVSISQLSPARLESAMPKPLHDLQLVGAGPPAVGGSAVGLHLEIEDLLLLAAEQREDAVRRQLGQRLGEVEIIGELGALGLLAVAHLGGDARVGPHLLAQRADQVGVLGEAFDQDRAGAVERGRDVRDALLGVDEAFGDDLGIVAGLRQQLIGERLEAGLLGDLAPWCGASA